MCYEVTYESVAITVSKGTNYCYVTNLTNGTEYTFTVKSVDTSGNKSEGVTMKETPVAIDAGDTMKIELSAPEALSNTSTPVTAKITSASKIKKVVYKKNGSMNAAELIADSEAYEATKKEASDDSEWIFDADEKTTYTVAAIDESGREETAQIFINTIDKVPPAEVRNLTSYYSETGNFIELRWNDPAATADPYDSPFDHVVISYTIDGGTEVTTVPKTVAKGVCAAAINGIDATKECYLITVYTVDKLGNVSNGKLTRCYITNAINATFDNAAEKISGMTQSGTVKITGEAPNSEYDDVFFNIRKALNSLEAGIYVTIDFSESEGLVGLMVLASPAADDNTSLVGLILPRSVTRIYSKALNHCTSLVSVIFEDTESEWFRSVHDFGGYGESIGSMSATDVQANANILRSEPYSYYYFYNENYTAE